MTIERTVDLKTTEQTSQVSLTYQAEYVDHSFAHAFGVERQGQYEITRWELSVSKFVLGWKTVTLDCLEIPEPLYDTLNDICEKHLKDNPIPREDILPFYIEE